jgi:hypothetical protein
MEISEQEARESETPGYEPQIPFNRHLLVPPSANIFLTMRLYSYMVI